ncbi:MAG: hypothetical protein GTO45_42095 [Candidatus Aminicenantes bacterium]|nr:hypothetical protein [Candidatus Aminicenantes bacterium]NIM85191.1 hypothetical protein [Candidatus Aminicenantes bacterium]NIN24721.1 hypothetical protein [Candidatus Aminicenantes bacterium]NIN48479.1 hypothetical protein [Candidatus Aminicenantes bacterium]NIN91379.1 hypothetical protein [Candidatus Aminicenantes bacterium]
MRKKLKLHHDGLHQHILMVEIDNTTVGLLADRISSVSHLPKDIIDTTPAVISSYGKENKGIAKLNTGTRMILLVDETLIRSSGEMTAISQIQEEQAKTSTETEIPKSDFAFRAADFICIMQGACENSMAHGNLFIKKKRRTGFQDGPPLTSKSPPSTFGFPWAPRMGRPAHLPLSHKGFTFRAADFICTKQGACGNGMAHGNLFLKLKYRINCLYAATCLSSPSLPLHFNISMGAPQGSPCPPSPGEMEEEYPHQDRK